jgi:hypothetical protein
MISARLRLERNRRPSTLSLSSPDMAAEAADALRFIHSLPFKARPQIAAIVVNLSTAGRGATLHSRSGANSEPPR